MDYSERDLVNKNFSRWLQRYAVCFHVVSTCRLTILWRPWSRNSLSGAVSLTSWSSNIALFLDIKISTSYSLRRDSCLTWKRSPLQWLETLGSPFSASYFRTDRAFHDVTIPKSSMIWGTGISTVDVAIYLGSVYEIPYVVVEPVHARRKHSFMVA